MRPWRVWRVHVASLSPCRVAAAQATSHALRRRLLAGWYAWRRYDAGMRAYLEVAAFQFSHAVLQAPDNPSEPAPGTPVPLRRMQRVWRCSRREKQDWALLHASRLGHLPAVQALVWRGAAVGVCDGLGQTALHAASFEGHTEVLRTLLSAKDMRMQIDVRDANGHSSLMLACLRGHLQLMRMLIEAGADDGSLWLGDEDDADEPTEATAAAVTAEAVEGTEAGEVAEAAEAVEAAEGTEAAEAVEAAEPPDGLPEVGDLTVELSQDDEPLWLRGAEAQLRQEGHLPSGGCTSPPTGAVVSWSAVVGGASLCSPEGCKAHSPTPLTVEGSVHLR